MSRPAHSPRLARWLLWSWPGLEALWLEGSWRALGVAIGFGAVLDLLGAATYVWFELFSSAQLILGWGGLALVWAMSAAISRQQRKRNNARQSAPATQDLFQTAMTEYLRGHWYDAEAAVSRLVAKNPKDIEARLLWATLLRRAGRGVEARAQLKQLERLDGAEPCARKSIANGRRCRFWKAPRGIVAPWTLSRLRRSRKSSCRCPTKRPPGSRASRLRSAAGQRERRLTFLALDV